jgi:hypothetical protein
MGLFKIAFERLPMVWLLLGLLMISGGLYLGFEYSLSFVYIYLGMGCSLYGLLLFIFMRRERPRTSEARRLSPNFISAGGTVVMRSPNLGSGPQTEQPEA